MQVLGTHSCCLHAFHDICLLYLVSYNWLFFYKINFISFLVYLLTNIIETELFSKFQHYSFDFLFIQFQELLDFTFIYQWQKNCFLKTIYNNLSYNQSYLKKIEICLLFNDPLNCHFTISISILMTSGNNEINICIVVVIGHFIFVEVIN